MYIFFFIWLAEGRGVDKKNGKMKNMGEYEITWANEVGVR